MMICQQCGDLVEELLDVKIDTDNLQVCPYCYELHEEQRAEASLEHSNEAVGDDD